MTPSPTALRKPSKPLPDAEKTEGTAHSPTIAEKRPASRHAHFRTHEESVTEKDADGSGEGASATSNPPAGIADNDSSSLKLAMPAPVHQSLNLSTDYFSAPIVPSTTQETATPSNTSLSRIPTDNEQPSTEDPTNQYTDDRRAQPPETFIQQLRPWSGRLRKDNWFRVAARPFILFCYPSILWSTLIYSLSIGWLIVLSESVATIYENKKTYNFNSLQTGLVYISPFVGGILGTVVAGAYPLTIPLCEIMLMMSYDAGKVSDRVVRFLARKNGGIYEPEFRLVMAIPIALSTTIGLMGYGWSAEEHDRWIVPTFFFGVISFGCSLGSTTAITFAVDSYRQYAGEALVTLNFSKNILHGLVFSLFFNRWLDAEGSKDVFVAIGGIQMACLLTTIPMYIYGKRARMWTVRRNLLEKF